MGYSGFALSPNNVQAQATFLLSSSASRAWHLGQEAWPRTLACGLLLVYFHLLKLVLLHEVRSITT